VAKVDFAWFTGVVVLLRRMIGLSVELDARTHTDIDRQTEDDEATDAVADGGI
jgi:hypothetical protein